MDQDSISVVQLSPQVVMDTRMRHIKASQPPRGARLRVPSRRVALGENDVFIQLAFRRSQRWTVDCSVVRGDGTLGKFHVLHL